MNRRRPRSRRLAAPPAALVLLLSIPAPGRSQAPPPVAPGAEPVEEVLVTAPEPRYVAPTTRDRIGRIWAPVLINGKGPYRLVLDTGASHSAVIQRVVDDLGLPVKTKAAWLRGVTGSAVVSTVKVDTLEFGELRIDDVTLPIVADAFGVLGGDGLKDKRIQIEFRKDRISVARSHGAQAPAGYAVLPFKYSHYRGMRTEVLVAGIKTIAVIDTGGQATVGNLALREALARARRERDPQVDSIQGVTEEIQYGTRIRVPNIVAGELIVRDAGIMFSDLNIFDQWQLRSTPALLVGMDVLGVIDTLIIDYRRSELQIKPRS
jgi:predicted aspartyl protease